MKKEIARSEESSGNVFKDLGLENPELEMLKAQLALSIFRIFEKKKLNQTQAAELLGVDQPEISKLKNGNFSRFRVERLFLFLNILGQDIDIKISAAHAHPHLHVKTA